MFILCKKLISCSKRLSLGLKILYISERILRKVLFLNEGLLHFLHEQFLNFTILKLADCIKIKGNDIVISFCTKINKKCILISLI